MTRPASLLQRALGVFVLLALCLAAFLWLAKTLLPRPAEEVYLDARRLAALRTFERAIVPRSALGEDVAPAAEAIGAKFAFCTDLPRDRGTPAARARRADPCASANPAEALACHLRTINARLAEMSESGAERALAGPYAVSLERWIEAMRDPLQPVGCREAFAAARQLAAGEGRLLALLAWRDLTPKGVVARQFAAGESVKVAGRLLEQRNPWGGVPGCIYYGDPSRHGRLLYLSDAQQRNRTACVAMRPKGTAAEHLQPASDPPASLEAILAELDHIRLPWRDLYRAYTEKGVRTLFADDRPLEKKGPDPFFRVAASHGPNRLARGRHEVDAGFSVQLTIDPDAQRIVQQASQCYAGDAAACERIGLAQDRRFQDFSASMYEKAAVRMAAVALIDVASGRIEALGSAHTDCYRQEYDGPGRSARECPDLPTLPRYEPDRLLNHALYTAALPGSIVKPILAAGFLSDEGYRRKVAGERVAADFVRLQDELKGSDSVAFLNRMFCADKGWTNCERPRQVQQAALAFGWNAGCTEPSFRCGRLNALFGVADVTRIRSDTHRSPLGASVLYGRLLTEPASAKKPADLRMMQDFSFEPRHAAACASGQFYSGSGRNRGWRKCRQGHLVYLESEGWGQGNARATALGAAGMVARLAAAANGQASQRMPYLVERVSDARGEPFALALQQFGLAEAVPIVLRQADAALIVRGMVSHKARGTPAGSRSGTAHVACARVFGAAECNRIDWIAGKTGTPPYGNDGLTLKEMRQKCRATSCDAEQPYKWYVAAFRSGAAAEGFDKAIAVLTERNWHRSGPLAGKVQSPGDLDGMNVSAELAFRIIARLRKA